VSREELIQALANLAENCRFSHPETAACLYGLAGAVTAGAPWPRRHMDATAGLTAEAILAMGSRPS
jgi:hypothetical protein